MLSQRLLYRFSKSKRGRKYSNVVFIVSDSKMIVCQKCFFTPQLKTSFGTDGLHIFEAGFEKLLRVNAEVGPDHLAHAVVRNDFIALLITNSERIWEFGTHDLTDLAELWAIHHTARMFSLIIQPRSDPKLLRRHIASCADSSAAHTTFHTCYVFPSTMKSTQWNVCFFVWCLQREVLM